MINFAFDILFRDFKIRALFALSAISLAVYPAWLEHEAKAKALSSLEGAVVEPAPRPTPSPPNYSQALSPQNALLAQVKKQGPLRPVLDKKARAYEDLILSVSQENKISPALIRAVIQAESKFNHYAVSSQGAVGLMQVLPSTARSMGVSSPEVPRDNIMAGARYLKALLNQFNDKEYLAIAAYNCGPEAIKRYGNKLPPFRETRKFVSMVMEYYHSQIDS
ncbi:MAG: lytic transglycosylase domain-containing protein [Deltaproteobacteria bacterium]|jgi:soluble lytic murein transglycosylase-like protein|nr:lytic transglycosylase domain-containing protein [Deltaproteobacteria bacterium]